MTCIRISRTRERIFIDIGGIVNLLDRKLKWLEWLVDLNQMAEANDVLTATRLDLIRGASPRKNKKLIDAQTNKILLERVKKKVKAAI